jgi:hypothetical protein
MGVIFASPACIGLQGRGLKLAAALAFTAALFHVLNHSFSEPAVFRG